MEPMSKNLQFTIADLHAPRFFKKRYDLLDRDNIPIFKKMKSVYPELKEYTTAEIIKCVRAVNAAIAIEVLDNRNGVRLSDGLGIIVAGACKINTETASKNIDYKESKRLGKLVYYQNQISDQYIAKVKYSNDLDRHMFDNHHMWCFDADRKLSSSLAKEFRKEGGYKKYIVFTTRQHIGHLFRKLKIQKVSSTTEQMKLKRLVDHNEFDI